MFNLFGEGKRAIAYSIPLKLSDGSVYGVLGIDITQDYLREFIPNEEIADSGTGAYILALEQEDGTLSDALVNGAAYTKEAEEGKKIKIDSSQYYAYSETLNLYNSNTPFSDEKWVLTGAAPLDSIMDFAKKVELAPDQL